MKIARTRQEKPLYAYILITISFVIGIVCANAQGQSPRLGGQKKVAAGVSHRLIPGHQSPNHVQRRWVLGVRADATQSGYLIRHVEPRSAASRIGLEPGDRIVTIDGNQIGLLGLRVVRLSDTLERQGGHDGRVRLLVQNRRNGQLVSVSVRLRDVSHHLGH